MVLDAETLNHNSLGLDTDLSCDNPILGTDSTVNNPPLLYRTWWCHTVGLIRSDASVGAPAQLLQCATIGCSTNDAKLVSEN